MKKMISIVLSMVFVLFTTLPTIAENGTGNTPVDTSKMIPKLVVKNEDLSEFTAGGIANISVVLKNVSDHTAKDINVELVEFDTSVFEVRETSLKRHIEMLRPDKESALNYSLYVKADAKAGVYPVKVKYEFKNSYQDTMPAVTETIYVEIVHERTPVNLKVENIDVSKSVIDAGDDFTLKFNLMNLGETSAKNIKVTIEGLDQKGLTINNSANEKYIEYVLPKQKSNELSYSMNASKEMVTGNHKLTVKVEYEGIGGEKETKSQDIFIKVQGEEEQVDDSDILIGAVKSSSNIVEEQGTFTITVPVKNIGKDTAENVKVYVGGSEGVVPTSDSMVLISSLKAGEEKIVKFSFKALKGTTEGQKPITIEVTNGDNKATQNFGIYVDVEDEEETEVNSSKPIIIIDKYTIDPNIAKAGEEFKMNVQFQNTHKSKTVENIKIMIKAVEKEGQDSQDVFVPVDGSTTFYIDSIAPKSTQSISTTMFTIPDAKSKTYKLSVSIEYEYKEGNEIKPATVSDEVGVTVRQNSSFMASDVVIPPYVSVGMPIPISLEINNTGKIELSNFMVEIEGDFQTDTKKYFVGNIAPGNREYYDAEIIPMTGGEQTGALIFTYEEPTGEVVTERREFTINVEEMIEPPTDPNGGINPPIDPGTEGMTGEKSNTFLYAGIGVGVVAVIAVVVVLRKRKKKKEMEELELDE